jgi:hypothetical protein
MPAARVVKAVAAVALFNGALYLAVAPEAWALSDTADAKKYTEDLKKAKDAKTKVTALTELGKLAAVNKTLVEAALPDIYKALEDKDASIRAAAATAIGQCDEPAEKVVPILRKMLNEDKDESAKIGATRGLANVGPNAKAALPDLRKMTGDKKSKLGKAANVAVKAINARKN